jgi:hypothetical protein
MSYTFEECLRSDSWDEIESTSVTQVDETVEACRWGTRGDLVYRHLSTGRWFAVGYRSSENGTDFEGARSEVWPVEKVTIEWGTKAPKDSE